MPRKRLPVQRPAYLIARRDFGGDWLLRLDSETGEMVARQVKAIGEHARHAPGAISYEITLTFGDGETKSDDFYGTRITLMTAEDARERWAAQNITDQQPNRSLRWVYADGTQTSETMLTDTRDAFRQYRAN